MPFNYRKCKQFHWNGISAADVDGGSTDNRGIASLSVDRTLFSCADSWIWTPAAGLAANGASASFAPNGAGSFTLTALATSENGCAASTAQTVNVIDARRGDKVLVCNDTGSERNPGAQLCLRGNDGNSTQPVLRKPAATPLMDK